MQLIVIQNKNFFEKKLHLSRPHENLLLEDPKEANLSGSSLMRGHNLRQTRSHFLP